MQIVKTLVMAPILISVVHKIAATPFFERSGLRMMEFDSREMRVILRSMKSKREGREGKGKLNDGAMLLSKKAWPANCCHQVMRSN